MLSLLSHQVTLKGQNRVNYARVIKVHCTLGRGGGGGGNSLMKGTGMFIRDFKIQRRGRQQERQKHNRFTIGLISKTTTSHVHHTFFYISFPFLHDYDVKMPNFAFYGGRKQTTTKFISLSELEYGPLKFRFRRVRLQLTK